MATLLHTLRGAIAIAVLLAAALLAGCQSGEPEPTETPIVVTAWDLAAEWLTNRERFDAQYKGRPVTVEGQAETVVSGFVLVWASPLLLRHAPADTIYSGTIVLRAGGNKESGFRYAALVGATREQKMQLTAGDFIRADCRVIDGKHYAEWPITVVGLSHCVLVN